MTKAAPKTREQDEVVTPLAPPVEAPVQEWATLRNPSVARAVWVMVGAETTRLAPQEALRIRREDVTRAMQELADRELLVIHFQ